MILLKKLIIITTNPNHFARNLNYDNLAVEYYDELDMTKVLEDLAEKHNVDYMTIQSGGSLNGLFLRENLIDYVNIVVAPILIGGKDVVTLIDGEAISGDDELHKLRALELQECNKLNGSYVQLKYKVIK